MNSIDYHSFVHDYNILVYIAFSLFFIAILSFEFISKKRYSVVFLFLGGLSLFSYMAVVYPFLHVWDEQFHALVAKNMMHHPFTPTLIDHPILAVSSRWDSTNIWLHKQPFFLWQMALSMKLFGVNTFALRIPSIIMASLLPVFVYRIGKIVLSKSLGFYAALLFLTSSFLLVLIPGVLNTDHNDIAFIFYNTASFWAWFEYQNSKNKYWLIAIGLFSGIAILTKWLVGLIVYAGWGLNIILNKNKRLNFQYYSDLIKSFLITVVVSLPWQIYILLRFPKLSRQEFAMNTRHFHEILEGHDGAWNYHLLQWNEYINPFFYAVIPLALVVFLFLKIKVKYKIAIISWTIIVTVFFSLAATKMPAFTFIISPLLFILALSPIDIVISKIKIFFLPQSLIRIILFVFLFYTFFSFDTLRNNPGWRKDKWKENYEETQTFKQLAQTNFPKNAHFSNFYFHGAVRFLFYAPYKACSHMLNKKEINVLQKKEVAIYVFDNGKLPSYILNDTNITKIKSPIWKEYRSENIEFYK